MKTFFQLICVFLVVLSVSVFSVDINSAVYISSGDLSFDGEDIVVFDGGVLTVEGSHNFNSIHILSGGIITHNQGSMFYLTVADDVVIDSGGGINVNGKGYVNQQGPGAGTGIRTDYNGGGGGGAYGGNGGNPGSTYSGGVSYGSITEPTDFGSGGGDGLAGIGGYGGGAIRLSVGGTLANNGIISADGYSGLHHNYGASGGGSGGSIWIDADIFNGSGKITANGGRSYDVSEEDGGGGGGGRIAVYYNSSEFAGNFEAFGGISHPSRCGGAGTIYTKHINEAYGQLLIDNNSNTNTRSNINTDSQFNLLVRNGAMPALASALTVNNALIETAGAITYPDGSYEIEFTVLGDLEIKTGGYVNANATIDVYGNLSIEPDGFITANGKGYANQQGPGAGTGTLNDHQGGGGGGAYGGNGGTPGSIYSGGLAYGSITEPAELGSGGGDGLAGIGGYGGGALRISIGGTLTNNGIVSADGYSGLHHSYGASGGGSGGSIWIDADIFNGSGKITANGGRSYDVSEEDGGGGGGGRIAVYYNLSEFVGNLEAFGGISQSARCGGAGTIYAKNINEIYGLVVLDNNLNTNTRSNINTESQFDLVVKKGAMPAIDGSITVNNVLVEAGGVITHTAAFKDIDMTINGSLTVNSEGLINANSTLTVAGDVTVEPDGIITASGKGYANEQGPGAGTGTLNDHQGGGGGGAYGGNGGNPESIYSGGIGYGKVLEPDELGSGGGDGLAGIGGYGGGRIRISSQGTITNNGIISSNGFYGRNHTYGASGGGSGGSIWIDSHTIVGIGKITANGGIGYSVAEEDSGAGGGGRIAVYYQINDYEGAIEAFGGTGATGRMGGAGTIATGLINETKLVTVSNNNIAEGLTHFDTDEQFDLLVKDGGKAAPVSMLTVKNATIAAGGFLTHPSATTDIELTALIGITIQEGGYIWASPKIYAYNLTVDQGGYINANGKGYANQQGPGAGTGTRSDSYGGGGGGGYGNWGGNPESWYSGGAPYGNMYCPLDYGSGGGDGYAGIGGYGGGAIQLHISETLTNNGTISANGNNGYYHSYGASGGGAGGGIWITTSNLAGSGSISANGGNGHIVAEEDSGGGSGGRIAIYSQNALSFQPSLISVDGGIGYQSGGVGTIYIAENNQSFFVLDNADPRGVFDGYVSYIDVEFSSPVNETTFTTDDITLTSPGGLVSVSGVERIVPFVNRFIYRISFPLQTTEGLYTLQIGSDITSASGAMHDQNHNGITGEPEDVFIHQFTTDYMNQPELLILLGAWLEIAENNEQFPQDYDFVDDDIIDILDFAEFGKLWPGKMAH